MFIANYKLTGVNKQKTIIPSIFHEPHTIRVGCHVNNSRLLFRITPTQDKPSVFDSDTLLFNPRRVLTPFSA
jgi:hypothetical protein